MSINSVGSMTASPVLARGFQAMWPVPAALERRTENVAAMPRLSDATVAALRSRLDAADTTAQPSRDPTLGSSKVSYERIDGELFARGGPTEADIRQGALGDCYFLASLASVVADNPKAIRNAIEDNGDGTYSVRFYKDDGKPVWITVDGDLPVDKKGRLAYAKGADSDGDGKLELWVPIMEKAYAAFEDKYGPSDGVDGYKDIGRGGSSSDAIEALTGKASRFERTPSSDSALEDLLSAANDGAEVVVSTKKGADQGWVGNHAYTVLGTYEKDGQIMVRLRNPWGSTEPDEAITDRRNDGVFDIALDDLRGQIRGIHTDEPQKQAVSALTIIARWFW